MEPVKLRCAYTNVHVHEPFSPFLSPVLSSTSFKSSLTHDIHGNQHVRCAVLILDSGISSVGFFPRMPTNYAFQNISTRR